MGWWRAGVTRINNIGEIDAPDIILNEAVIQGQTYLCI